MSLPSVITIIIPLNQNSREGRNARLVAKHRRMAVNTVTGKPTSAGHPRFRTAWIQEVAAESVTESFGRYAMKRMGGPINIRITRKPEWQSESQSNEERGGKWYGVKP